MKTKDKQLLKRIQKHLTKAWNLHDQLSPEIRELPGIDDLESGASWGWPLATLERNLNAVIKNI